MAGRSAQGVTIRRVNWSQQFAFEIADAAGELLGEVKRDVERGISVCFQVDGVRGSLYMVVRGNGQSFWVDAIAGKGLLTKPLCERIYQAARKGGFNKIKFVTTEAGIVDGLRRFGYNPVPVGRGPLGGTVYTVAVGG